MVLSSAPLRALAWVQRSPARFFTPFGAAGACVACKGGVGLGRVQHLKQPNKVHYMPPLNLILLRWPGCRPRLLEYFKDAASIRLDIVSLLRPACVLLSPPCAARPCILSTAGQGELVAPGLTSMAPVMWTPG